jgi:hypothetical protein
MPPGWQRLAMLQLVKSQVAVSALVVDVTTIMAAIRDRKKINLVLERIFPSFIYIYPKNFRALTGAHLCLSTPVSNRIFQLIMLEKFMQSRPYSDTMFTIKLKTNDLIADHEGAWTVDFEVD